MKNCTPSKPAVSIYCLHINKCPIGFYYDKLGEWLPLRLIYYSHIVKETP